MDKSNIKLTASEIGSLWGQYINGTMTYQVNKYMVSIIEDESILSIFNEALTIFEKQKQQIVFFFEKEGFPIPIGFTDEDLNKNAERLFTDIFCLNYLHIMSLHSLIGNTTSLSVSVRKDLRNFYVASYNETTKIYYQTIELLLDMGDFQRDPLIYPDKNPQFISSMDFIDGTIGKGRCLSALEIISLSLNIKKSVLAKTLSIGFSQVAQSKEVRGFLRYSQKISNSNIQDFSKILYGDNLPVPKSWETEVTISTDPPFSDKLMMYHIGFLSQVAQAYLGEGLASSMRTDLVMTYEKTILKILKVTKKWFNIMVQNKWLEQPPLVPNRKEIADEK